MPCFFPPLGSFFAPRFFAFFALFFAALFGPLSAADLASFSTRILAVENSAEGDFIYIQDGPQVRLHANGALLRDFNDTRAILSSAVVVAKDIPALPAANATATSSSAPAKSPAHFAKLRLTPFTLLAQPALPSLAATPTLGDELILNFLYHRAILIAPSQEAYEAVEAGMGRLLPGVSLIHIDILGASLIARGRSAPSRADLASFCSANALGLALFALGTELYTADCQSLEILDTQPLPKAPAQNFSPDEADEKAEFDEDGAMLPFYSRLSGYRNDLFNLLAARVKNYAQYYRALLGLPNAPK